jgi:transcriptional regulator GlxA family with amidase domain
MASFSALTSRDLPVRIAILYVENDAPGSNLDLAGLVAPLRLAKQVVGAAQLELTVHAISAMDSASLTAINQNTHLALLVADQDTIPPTVDDVRRLSQYCQQARYWGGVGAAVLWLACAGRLPRMRAALPWAMYGDVNEEAEQAILVPNLFELDGACLTCCGGTASIDFSLTLIQALFGADVEAQVMEALCVERVRSGDERQRIALQTRFGALQPQLSEAVTLMENNIEETLSTDEIAQLVGLSRRQLERQFKQYLGTMPSRYYLELRLKKARQLLLESNSSIVQIGLMCGFSSGAHFSTAFGAQFGITPRQERQRKLSPD